MRSPQTLKAQTGQTAHRVAQVRPVQAPQVVRVRRLIGNRKRRLGRRVLLKQLADGPMADVFLSARLPDPLFCRLEVVKILKQNAQPLAGRDALLREAQIGSYCSHPHIAATVDLVHDPREPHLVGEYVAGKTLGELLQCDLEPFTWREPLLLEILVRVLDALQHLHTRVDSDGVARGLAHLDVCPSNVMVGTTGEVKLIDFGAASCRSHQNLGPPVPLGRLGYVAPERLRGAVGDAQSDIFSCGAILFHALSGLQLWHGLPEQQVRRRLDEGDVPCCRHLRPDIDPELADICSRSLLVEPEERYPSAAAMRQDIVRYLSRTGERYGTETIGHYVRRLFSDEFAQKEAWLKAELLRLVEQEQLVGDLRAEQGASPRSLGSSFGVALTGALVGGGIVFATALLSRLLMNAQLP